jgi:hypothetical protein
MIVGIYAIVRLLEILTSAENRHASASAMWTAKTAAALAIAVVAFLTIDIVMAGAAGQSPFATPQVEGPQIFHPPPPKPQARPEYRR